MTLTEIVAAGSSIAPVSSGVVSVVVSGLIVTTGATGTTGSASIVTVALLAALGHYDEMAMHVRATARTGATEADVREALLHVAIYAGVPVANQAIKYARQAFADVAAGRPD